MSKWQLASWAIIAYLIFGLAITFALSGCSAEYHMKRACRKQPSICRDSVRIERDTLVEVDTLTYLDTFELSTVDTIVIDTNGCKLQLTRNGDKFKAAITSKIPTKTITTTITNRRWITYTRERFKSLTTLVKWLCGLGVIVILFLAFLRYSINGRH